MQPNWDYVKKTTLWRYDDLIAKLRALTAYPVIWQAYNHDMPRAIAYAKRLFADINLAAGEYPADVIRTIARLQTAGVRDWGDLLERIATQAGCIAFVAEHDLIFEELIDVLNYLLRWAFPFQTSSRELLEHENPQEMAYYGSLKRHQIMTSFDLLEHGRTRAGRSALADLTGLPLEFITALVHRADIARLPYVRRKTILPLCGAGYDSLAKIAAADQTQMEADLDVYFRRTQGKPWENFKSVIVLRLLMAGAQALPVLLEE
jgi:hypothetical protein